MVKRTDVKVPVKQDGKTKRTLEGEIEAFRAWLTKHQERKPADKTLLNYEKFFVTLTTTYGLDINNLEPLLVCDNIKQASTSPYTKRQYLNTLKHYLKYRGIKITDQVKQALKAQRGDKTRILTPGDLITREELETIIKATKSVMLSAYYAMLWDTGARPSELARLDIQNFSEDAYGFVIHITKSKTAAGRRKVRIMTPYCINHIGHWWNKHPRRDDPDAPLFINNQGRRLSVHPTLNNLRGQHNKRLGRGNGNGKAPLNLYLFRKSAATRWIKEGKFPDRDIKKLLGHSPDSSMLDKYYAILSAEDLEESQLEAMGIVETKKEQDALVSCPNPACGMMNEPGATHCLRCKYPLTEEAIQQHISLEEQVANLQQNILTMGQAVVDITNHLAFMPEDELRERMAVTRDATSLLTLVRVQDMLANESKVELQKRIDAFNVEQEKEGKTKISIAIMDELVAGAPKIELQQILQNPKAIVDMIRVEREKKPKKQARKKKK